MTNDNNDGKAALLEYVRGLHPAMEIPPVDLLPGGAHALPPGFECHIDDAHDERIRVFGPEDRGTFVPTRRPWGGDFRVTGMDLLRGLADLCRVGEPRWSRSLDERADYFRELIAEAAPFAVPQPAPMTRAQMEQHIETCARCQPVSAAFIEAINSGANIAGDVHVRTMIDKAHTDQAAAVQYYLTIRDGRNNIFLTSGPQAPAKPTRTRRVAQEVSS